MIETMIKNDNPTPPLFALTPISETAGLESKEYWVVIETEFRLYRYNSEKEYWIDSTNTNGFHKDCCPGALYLRPLPEGTRVLKPGEVAVSEEDIEAIGAGSILHEKLRNILTKLAQMGE